ncbi:MAG: VWA domain-containing protein, partial [Terriglobales bacterium]
PAPPPPGVTEFNNTHERARSMVVVLFDALNTADGTEYSFNQPTWRASHSFALAKQGALRYLAHLDPNARVALYGLDTQLRVLSDFTSNRNHLLAALRAYNPATEAGADRGGEATDVPGNFNALNGASGSAYDRVIRRAQQVDGTVPALQQIASHLAGLPGRISLVWMLTRPPLTGAAVEAALGRDNIAVYTLDTRGLQARDGVVAVSGDDNPDGGLCYACSVARLTTEPSGLRAMEDIANQTGGRAFINTNDIAGALTTALADSSASYSMGFYIQSADVDNRFHQIRVKVRGKDRQVRFPHGYWALHDPAKGLPRGAAALAAALRSPLEASAIALQAELKPAADGFLVSGRIYINNLRLSDTNGRHTGVVVLESVSQDLTGKPLAATRTPVLLQLNEAEYLHLLQTGLRFEQQVELAPGAVTLRLIAADPSSAAVGSLIIPLPSAH